MENFSGKPEGWPGLEPSAKRGEVPEALPILGPKTHPATREILPDDPLELSGFEVDGDPELMLRLLVEEYARMGWGLDALMELARNPFYVGFHGLWRAYGEEELKKRMSEVLARCGVVRITTRETQPLSERLVQIALPSGE